jgi:hypothetical protein
MTWIRQAINDPILLKAASDTLHQAAQYIPMTARKFIKEVADDSHTNAKWIKSKNWLIGNLMETPNGKVHVALDYPLLVLIICNENLEPIAELELVGKTRLEGFNWLNESLWNLGLNMDGFEMALHYDLADHPVLHGEKFEMENSRHFLELANYRTNGHFLLEWATEKFEDKSTVRVWPHHFDEGILVNLKKNGESVSALLSMGMAIADPYYNQPYFYVNAWSENDIDYSTLPHIEGNGHWHEKEWKGQVLTADKFSSIIDHKEQEELCKSFITSAIKNGEMLIQ